jgi:hypothetical protein
MFAPVAKMLPANSPIYQTREQVIDAAVSRTDYSDGLKLGEAVALSILRDQKACYREDFAGFQITKFDGTRIIV